jgi:FKBP-type peptidyl-prolyl cis-trans isomerase
MKTKWIRIASHTLIALWLAPLLATSAGAQQTSPGALPGATPDSRAEALQSAKLSPRQRAEFEKAAQAEKNTQAGAGFLAANKSKPGVTSLPSGVQYKVLKAGGGKRPTESSTVLCRYKGALSDGTVFDKSDEKTPVKLKVAGLVPGLKEVVKLMPVGAQWEVTVPSALGYGARGKEGVGPNAVLSYVVELVDIQ